MYTLTTTDNNWISFHSRTVVSFFWTWMEREKVERSEEQPKKIRSAVEVLLLITLHADTKTERSKKKSVTQ